MDADPCAVWKGRVMAAFVITAGHSNADPGALANGRKEADIACDMRNMVALKLRQRGHTVTTDGAGGTNLPLAAAVRLVQDGQPAIEFHCNAAVATTATGVETISRMRDKLAAQRISQAVGGVLGLRLRGDGGWIDQSQSARGRLGFVRAGGMIVELFFLTNESDLAAWDAKKWLAATAVADELEAEL